MLNEHKKGENYSIYLLIKSAEKRMTSKSSPYIRLTLTDRSGEIQANLWDASEEDVANYVPGKVVYLNVLQDEYQSKPQLKIQEIRLANETEPSDPSLYEISSPVSKKELQSQINDLLFQITNPTWNRVVRNILNKYADKYYEYPAAEKIHHAYRGGLAFHSLSIAKLALAVSDLYPQINRSLLLAGALLHDIGKTKELSGPVGTEYTTEGQLLGHIIIGDEIIVQAAEELGFDLNSEDMLLLRHLILSHHNKLKFGSPIQPRELEAFVLSKLDDLDSHIQLITTAVNKTSAGNFSEKIFAADNQAYYRPKTDLSEKSDQNDD
ncbi:3'-5' exonuclease [Oenococcus oeni]|uniref:3'-5' exoribonuclease YhaM family protein n=1 Tax=Oenococcus oeni TaxID=1247 RepID=UPI000BDF3B70|nr:HD domain-containing protein [Oenococcus oeni]PDH75939.1 3'-5' exonuclease [Oenococcus oeni]